MKKIVFLLFLIFAVARLSAQKQVKIKGTLRNNTSIKQVTLFDRTGKNVLKLADVKNNKFELSVEINFPDIFLLQFDQYNYVILVLSLDDKEVEIDYDFSNSENTSISGSRCSELYLNTVKDLRKQPTQEQQIDLIDTVINHNPACLTSVLLALNIINIPGTVETHKKLISSLDDMKNSPIVQDYIKRFEASQITAIGSIAPEIELPDTNGKIVKLSSFRGQYVLVDFWAAWCRPCRGESPNLVKAFNKYHDKGFTIYSVSLDQSKDSWLKAIHQDKLQKWTHVSDLKYWNSKAAKIYGVNAIPANFLLDPEGKIIDKNLRGMRLEQKLSEIFNN